MSSEEDDSISIKIQSATPIALAGTATFIVRVYSNFQPSEAYLIE
ncbi:hypothetical protein [Leptolyngbya sp. 'hensonii']|nr:hypothetical protein [Leptolyngbya sp. 'hensonii']